MPTISEILARAVALHRSGQVPQADQAYRQVLQADPRNADAWHLLGVVAAQREQHATAVEHIRRAIELNPRAAPFHANLGAAYQRLQRFDEAVACYRRALELNPENIEAHNNLGVALQYQGDPAAAEACFRHALKYNPNYADARCNLGNALQALGKPVEALAAFRHALKLKENAPETHNGLGNALREQGKLDEAIACHRRALELRPRYAEAHSSLGNALREQGRLDEAVACHRRALEFNPDFPEILNNLAVALRDQGKLDEALACFRRALEIKPGFVTAREGMIFSLHYRSGVTLAELAAAHAEFDRLHAAPFRANSPLHKPRDAPLRLRLGFVSADFGQHPVGYFLVRAIENLDRQDVEIACYSDRLAKDRLTARFQAADLLWRDVRGWSDEKLAARIRDDRIDILFDLAGHSAHNRILTFARKPAPVQITWIGYEGTTGLSAIDYLLADRHLVPEGAESHFRETVLRLPDCYVCYEPPADAPAVSPLPALRKGYVTFASCNNPAKINAEVVSLWAEILRRVPRARLLLKYRGLSDAGARARVLDLFALQGISGNRLDLEDWSSLSELLARHNDIDVALDPFPFAGGATTCNALWMGVPVVSWPGETFASRHALSFLTAIGLTETIAAGREQYVEIAAGLAADLPRLAAIRSGLRERMAASPLCDGKRFAGNLLTLLRKAWAKRSD